jgi:hypothetical protein
MSFCGGRGGHPARGSSRMAGVIDRAERTLRRWEGNRNGSLAARRTVGLVGVLIASRPARSALGGAWGWRFAGTMLA